MKPYLESTASVFEQTSSTPEGIGAKEAAVRLEKNGQNKLRGEEKPGLIRRFLAQLKDPMIIVLLVAAAVSAATGIIESGSLEADVFIILFVVLLNAVLGVYQESKAEKAIEALQQMTSATSKVLRDGTAAVIKSEDIVVGDVVLLEAGDSVPADMRIFESASLKTEEAALTGESEPVNKCIDMLYLKEQERDVTLGDRKNMAYMGSTVAYGRGKGVVVATGMDTEMGKIATAISETKEGQTPLQKKLGQLSVTLSRIVLFICVAIFAITLIEDAVRGVSIGFDTVLQSLLVAVSLAVAAIPEGLATVVTIVLSIGVTNMSKKNAVVRKLTAVETLGCAQIICSDKTGTLTQNKMTVVEYVACSEKLLGTVVSMCSDAEPDEKGNIVGEPTEAALVAFAEKLGLSKREMEREHPRVGEAPFDSQRKMMTTVHRSENGFVQFTKGAPDIVLSHCDRIIENGRVREITEEDRREILRENKRLADKALRCIMGALREYREIPDSFEPNTLEENLIYVGIAGMIDPVRPEVAAAIEKARAAGIRPIMITGDHRDTAAAIARELGILSSETGVLTGAELSQMSNEEFERRVGEFSVYARVQPEHKVRIVSAWKKLGKVVAMTGDGVNDAPSIKAADIGIGMGITGTDVTKNVADMVLADDNFATIVSAVEEGRRIYDNIRKAVQFLLSSNLSEVLCILVATLGLGALTGGPFTILLPVHLLWINLITDCVPAVALGMEKAEKNVMLRPPRPSDAGIFADGVGIDLVYQGIVVTVLTLLAYTIGANMDTDINGIHNTGVTMAFLTLSLCEAFHAFNLRSRHGSAFMVGTHNSLMLISVVMSLVLSALLIYVPFLSKIFSLVRLTAGQYFISLGLAVAIVPIVETIKFVQRTIKNKRM